MVTPETPCIANTPYKIGQYQLSRKSSNATNLQKVTRNVLRFANGLTITKHHGVARHALCEATLVLD